MRFIAGVFNAYSRDFLCYNAIASFRIALFERLSSSRRLGACDLAHRRLPVIYATILYGAGLLMALALRSDAARFHTGCIAF